MSLDNLPVGYLTWWGLSESITPEYVQLEKIASDASFPVEHVPKPIPGRQAWERATNLGRRGLKVEPATAKVDEAEQLYGVRPFVRLRSKTTCGKQPVLQRHLVREAVIPAYQFRDKQLHMKSLGVMEFDVLKQEAKTVLPYDTGDPDGWLDNETLLTTVDRINNHMLRLMKYAESGDIRIGVRAFLQSLHRVSLMRSTSVYFVPASTPNVEANLTAMRQYIRAISSELGYAGAECFLAKVDPKDEVTVSDLSRAIQDQLKEKLFDLNEKVQPIYRADEYLKSTEITRKGKGALGKQAETISKQALTGLLEVQAALQQYQQSLNMEFTELQALYEVTQSTIMNAQVLVSQQKGLREKKYEGSNTEQRTD